MTIIDPSSARLATLNQLLQTVIPAYLTPAPSAFTLRTWFDQARIPRFKSNSHGQARRWHGLLLGGCRGEVPAEPDAAVPVVTGGAGSFIRRHSQQFVDLIDLEENKLKSLPIKEVLNPLYPAVRYIAQVDEDGYLAPMRTNMVEPDQLVITFDELMARTPFAERMRTMLQVLEENYASPVDTEFTLEILDTASLQPSVCITLLQCRPQSQIEEEREVAIPVHIPSRDLIFSTSRRVPRGVVEGIHWVLFVPPEGYFLLEPQQRHNLERAISALKSSLKNETFICVGPGRWGTSTPDLGVSIAYGDIYHTRALVELTGQGLAPDLEPSFGTHFFQDLVEAHIYPLAIILGESGSNFNRGFFYETPNHIDEYLSSPDVLQSSLRLIKVDDFRPGHRISLIMNDDVGKAVAFLRWETV